jgi:hypothetical protein
MFFFKLGYKISPSRLKNLCFVLNHIATKHIAKQRLGNNKRGESDFGMPVVTEHKITKKKNKTDYLQILIGEVYLIFRIFLL